MAWVWTTQKDYLVCDWCRAREGTVAYKESDLTGRYKGYDEYPEHNRPTHVEGIPAHKQCRCFWKKRGEQPTANFYLSYPKPFVKIMLRGVSGWITLGTARESPIEFIKYEELAEGSCITIRLKTGKEYISRTNELKISIRSNHLQTKVIQLSATIWAEFRIINHSLEGKEETIVDSFSCRYINWKKRGNIPYRPKNKCDLEGNQRLTIGFTKPGILEMRCQLFEKQINGINSYPILNAINVFKTPLSYLETEEPEEEKTLIPLIVSYLPDLMSLFASGSDLWKNLITDVAAEEMPRDLPTAYSKGYDVVSKRMFRLTGEWLSPGVFRLQWKNRFPIVGYYIYRKKRVTPEKPTMEAWECINPIKTAEWYSEPAAMPPYTLQVVMPHFSLGTDVHLDVEPTYTGDIFYVQALGPIIAPESTDMWDIFDYLAVPFIMNMNFMSHPASRQSDLIVAGKMDPPEYP